MSSGFEKANEVAVVGSVDKVKEIGRNYQVFNSRLQKMYPPSSFTIRQKDEMPKIPTFNINMSHAKRYIDALGSVNIDLPVTLNNSLPNDKAQATHRNVNLKRSVIDGVPSQAEELQPANEYNPTGRRYNLGPILSQHVTIDNVYWPKWDSNEIYRFDFPSKQWVMHQQAKAPTKFLFFSSVCHLPLIRNPSNQSVWGMFILGGSDS